jgi:hypothetical protein
MTCKEHGFLWSPLGTARQKELTARKLSMPITSEFVDASTEVAVYHPEPVRDVDGDYVMGDNDNNPGTYFSTLRLIETARMPPPTDLPQRGIARMKPKIRLSSE